MGEDHLKRSAERAAVAIGASCRTDNGPRAFVAVIDLTVAGCCLFSPESPFKVGQNVMLHPECLAPIRGTVRWVRSSLAGLSFEKELYPAVFEHLAQTHPWQLSESAKLPCDVDMPSSLKRELLKILARAEEKFRKSNEPKDVMTSRPPLIGTRPGLARQATDGKLMQLFLA